MIEHAARDHRDVELGDERLEVERLAGSVPVLRDALGGDDGALDDQQVDARRDQHGRQGLCVLRAHPDRGGDSGLPDARHGCAEQVGIDRSRVQLLQQSDRGGLLGLLLGGLDDLGDLGFDVGVPTDQTFAVEHPKSTPPAEFDGELG